MEQPLSGIKVLEFSSFVAVPGVGRMMATWGADVIKVEGITGEVWRYMGGNYVSPSLDDENPLFTFCNANKRMISLDMRQPEALEVMKTLAKSCDVFLTNIRPASLKRQGLDYDSLKKINPGIIFADFTAYGDVGPDADEAGFDVASLWGRSGLMIDSVPKGCVPPRMTGGAGDLICSGYLLSGILSALIAKKQSGKGTRITSSLYWNGLWCASTGIISTQYGNPYPKDTLQPINPLVHTYLCKDQEWFCPGIQNYDLQHDKVLNAFGLSEYMDDPRFINVKAYLSVYWMVDSVSVKRNIARISENQIPSFFRELRENGVLMLPILLLVIQLGVLRFSAQRSAFVTTVAIIVINLFRKKNRYTVVGFVKALIMGTMDALEIVAVCGCAGIMIGIVMRSGLALSFTGALVDLSQGNLLLLLLLAMIASIFLGMGMPTAACYIIVAALAVPAIQTLGVSAQATHMFAFYFGCISSITPPVAIAAFTAAGIAKSKVMQTCLLAVKFGLAGFLVPYLFVYRSGLLLSGSPSQILIDILASGIGVFALSVALGGYFIHTITMVERIFLILICAAILVPEPSSTAVGIALFVIYAGALTVREKRRRASLTKGA